MGSFRWANQRVPLAVHPKKNCSPCSPATSYRPRMLFSSRTFLWLMLGINAFCLIPEWGHLICSARQQESRTRTWKPLGLMPHQLPQLFARMVIVITSGVSCLMPANEYSQMRRSGFPRRTLIFGPTKQNYLTRIQLGCLLSWKERGAI